MEAQKVRGFRFPRWHGDKHVGIGFDVEQCPLCAAIERVDALKAEQDSVKEIFDWFIKKIDAISLDGDTPSDVMAAFKEIASTCKRAAGMARLAKPAQRANSDASSGTTLEGTAESSVQHSH